MELASIKQVKYVFITGGVISSLGKGIAAATIGSLLKNSGFNITFLKMDPYINVDPGTMSPFQHGEVFVTEDGFETDLDLGHYERFADITTSSSNNFTAGKVYKTVIEKERRGDFLGQTVQVVPHITDQIKQYILTTASGFEIIIVEVGGTVGDIESLPFLEAIRQLKQEIGASNSVFIHLTLIPYIKSVEELKTKPTQHSVNKLREIGIQPDIILCRTTAPLSDEIKQKISLFTSVDKNAVIEASDVEFIYQIPVKFKKEAIDYLILKKLNLPIDEKLISQNANQWQILCDKYYSLSKQVNIGLIGKYTNQKDSYKSLIEALNHAAIANNVKLNIHYIAAENLESESEFTHFATNINKLHGIIVPGGFGLRGSNGVIKAIEIIRKNKIPFFGICFGMQYAIIEFARNVLKLNDADSVELTSDSLNPVVDLMESQKLNSGLGGTMRLGNYLTVLKLNSKIAQIYNSTQINERHRHRYELNSKYIDQLEINGLKITGYDEKSNLAETIEIEDHPWYIGVQYHPEFNSRPLKAHPLFISFIESSLKRNIN